MTQPRRITRFVSLGVILWAMLVIYGAPSVAQPMAEPCTACLTECPNPVQTWCQNNHCSGSGSCELVTGPGSCPVGMFAVNCNLH